MPGERRPAVGNGWEKLAITRVDVPVPVDWDSVLQRSAVLSNVANEGESVKARSNHDVHIDTGGLIRDNSEGLWPGANTLAHTILNVENIIPRRQRDPIISPFVGCDARDFFVVLLGQDDQRILSVRFRRNLWAGHIIGWLRCHTDDDFQMSFEETLLCCIEGCATGNQKNS